MRKGDVSHTVSPLFRANYEEQPATKLLKIVNVVRPGKAELSTRKNLFGLNLNYPASSI
jgi:hypothetical protein